MVFYGLWWRFFDFWFWFLVYEATNVIFSGIFFCMSINIANFLSISWILLALQLSLKHAFTGIFWTLVYFDAQYFILIGKIINNTLFWMVSISKGISLKTSFAPNRVLWFSVKVFFASNFLISSRISIKVVTNSQQERF